VSQQISDMRNEASEYILRKLFALAAAGRTCISLEESTQEILCEFLRMCFWYNSGIRRGMT